MSNFSKFIDPVKWKQNKILTLEYIFEYFKRDRGLDDKWISTFSSQVNDVLREEKRLDALIAEAFRDECRWYKEQLSLQVLAEKEDIVW